ncbi:MAG: hypothetical protein WDO74_37435 [Pseudomonadota bacterium]
MSPHLSLAIHHLRQVAEDTTDPKRAVAKNVLASCAARDKQRERLGLKPVFGSTLTDRPGVTTYDARDHQVSR